MADGYGYLDDLAFLLGPGPTQEQKMHYVETHRRPEGQIGFKLLPAAMRKKWLAWWDLMEQAMRHRDEAARVNGGDKPGADKKGKAQDKESEVKAQAEKKLDEIRGEKVGMGEVRYSQWTWPPRGWEGMAAEQTGEGSKQGKGKDKGKKDKDKGKGKGKKRTK
ncbi:hypothetical protein CDD82_5842 [Ophiocordyceps australis]|uniref:Uncharacterized protein n=1 Tax=Ophiocordyceps australis TaxID=1399860 RepID=A0A2C5Z072_9HYPO|nr:hypothetical protein CDD82_5842 [Ophiocordyceps australis]